MCQDHARSWLLARGYQEEIGVQTFKRAIVSRDRSATQLAVDEVQEANVVYYMRIVFVGIRAAGAWLPATRMFLRHTRGVREERHTQLR